MKGQQVDHSDEEVMDRAWKTGHLSLRTAPLHVKRNERRRRYRGGGGKPPQFAARAAPTADARWLQPLRRPRASC